MNSGGGDESLAEGCAEMVEAMAGRTVLETLSQLVNVFQGS